MVCSLHLQVGRTCPGRNQEVLGLDLEVDRLFGVVLWEGSFFEVGVDDVTVLGGDDGVFVLESCQAVEVLHLVVAAYVALVTEVN